MEAERDDDTQDEPLTAKELAYDLADVLYNATDELTNGRTIASTRTFDEYLSRHNDGLTVRLSDGAEYQLTIVRSN